MTVSDCRFAGNTTTDPQGKAVLIWDTIGLFVRCRVDSNQGGGLELRAEGDQPGLIDCTFRGNSDTAWYGGGIELEFDNAQLHKCTIQGCLIEGNSALAGGGIYAYIYYYDDINPGFLGLSVDSCTIVGNEAPSGSAISITSDWAAYEIRSSIIAYNEGGNAVSIIAHPAPYDCADVACTDIYGNPGVDWAGCIAPLLGVDGNISEDPLFCDPAAGDYTLDAASPCLANQACGTIGAFGEGCDVVTALAEDIPGVPRRAFLSNSFPNPFNPFTTVRFGLPRPSNVSIVVHDVAGRRVATLASGCFRAGTFDATWNGRDGEGRAVGSGVYFIRMEAGDFTATRKAILLR